eukprot:GILJ01007441.1.p1 GENE.GILJ01007441.1~~GILJ01007441.1.p1  ORF type:complete len:862 (-),score=78.47 GILJ01007441.1:127-2358(-)
MLATSLRSCFVFRRHDIICISSAVLLVYYSYCAVSEDPTRGVLTSVESNYGDLPFHVGVINSFALGQNFPPQNIEFSGAFFTYSYQVDFVSAMLVVLGSSIGPSIAAVNLVLFLATACIMYHFYRLLVGSKTGAALCVLFLFLNGGFSFVVFLSELVTALQGVKAEQWQDTVLQWLWTPPRQYTMDGRSPYRFGNVLTILLMPQRSFLLGFPLAFGCLAIFWAICVKSESTFVPAASPVMSSREIDGFDSSMNHMQVLRKKPSHRRFNSAESELRQRFLTSQSSNEEVPGSANGSVHDERKPSVRERISVWIQLKREDLMPSSVSEVEWRYMCVAGVCAGLLPLAHAHTFLLVMSVVPFLALLFRRWWYWFSFCAFAGVVSVPQALYIIVNQRSHKLLHAAADTGGSTANAILKNFFNFQYGWDNHGQYAESHIMFWFRNTGFLIPLVLIYLLTPESLVKMILRVDKTLLHGAKRLSMRAWQRLSSGSSVNVLQPTDQAVAPSTAYNGSVSSWKTVNQTVIANDLKKFYLPFLIWFIVPNLIRLSPWVWDNIKFLVYWFAMSIPLAVSLLMGLLRSKHVLLRAVSFMIVCTFIMSGVVDNMRVLTRPGVYEVFPQHDVLFGLNVIHPHLDKHALLARAPSHNHCAYVSGHRSVLGYIGHVWSHGIHYHEREQDLNGLFYGRMAVKDYVQKYTVEDAIKLYAVVGPHEVNQYGQGVRDVFKSCPVLGKDNFSILYDLTQCAKQT